MAKSTKKAAPTPGVKMTVHKSYASCDFYSTVTACCWLCGVSVPAKTQHHCQQGDGKP